MTDTSRDDGETAAPVDERDGPESTTVDGGSTPDGGVETSTPGIEDPQDPTPDPPEGTAVGDEGDDAGDSPTTAILVALGLGVLGPLIAVVGSFGIFALEFATGGLPQVVSLALTLIVGQYIAFAGLALVYLRWRGFDRSGIISYLGVRWPTPFELGVVVVGWVTILVTVIGISFVVQLLGAEPAANQSAEVAMANPALIPLLIVAMFLVVGPCEEILYRGVVQGRLRETLPAAPSIIIASAVFALIHVVALTGGIEGRLVTVAVLFFPSLVFGIVYEYTENIVVPSLLHGLHNAVIFTLLYVSIAFADEIEELAEMLALPLPF